jgi:hypothetical protein
LQLLFQGRIWVGAIGHGHQSPRLDPGHLAGQPPEKICLGPAAAEMGYVRGGITVKTTVGTAGVGIEAELGGTGA